jgi:hypothetical protein
MPATTNQAGDRDTMADNRTPRRKRLDVFGITERNEKSYFTKIGVAFVNSDGSINLKLEFLPANGQTIQLREPRPEDNGNG